MGQMKAAGANMLEDLEGAILRSDVQSPVLDEMDILLKSMKFQAWGEELCSLAVLRDWHDQDSRSSIHLACQLGLRKATEVLVHRLGPCVVSACDDLGSQPIHVAAQSGSLDIVQLLLDNGALATAMDRSGVSPMHHAASGGHTAIIELLRVNGASLETQSVAGTPLHWAAGEGQAGVVKMLLDLGVAKNPLDSDGFSPLGMAIVAGMEDVALLMMDAGASLAPSRLPNRLTFMHVAAELGLDVLAKRLLQTQAGRDMVSCEAEGRLPIHVAAEHGSKALVELLLPLSALAEGTTADELLAAAACAGGGWDSWDATESPFAIGSAMSISDGVTLFQGMPSGRTLQKLSTPISSSLDSEKTDFMSTTPITPPVPVAWPDEPRMAAATPEALAGASQSSARGDELLSENDLSGALKAYTDAILCHGADAMLWGKRAGVQLMLAQSEEPGRRCVLKAYGDAVVATEIDPQSPLARRVLGKALSLLGQMDDAEVQFARARYFDVLSGGAGGSQNACSADATALLEQRLRCGSGSGTGSGDLSCASPRYSALAGKQSPRVASRVAAARRQEAAKIPVSPLRMQLKKLGRPQLTLPSSVCLSTSDEQAVCSPLTKMRGSLRPMKLRI